MGAKRNKYWEPSVRPATAITLPERNPDSLLTSTSAHTEPGIFDPRSWGPNIVDYFLGDKLTFSDAPIGEGQEASERFEEDLADQWVSNTLSVAKYGGGMMGAIAGVTGGIYDAGKAWRDYWGGTGDLSTALASSAGAIQGAGDIMLPPTFGSVEPPLTDEYLVPTTDMIIYDQEGNELSAEQKSEERQVHEIPFPEFLYKISRLDIGRQSSTESLLLHPGLLQFQRDALDLDPETQVLTNRVTGEVVDPYSEEFATNWARSENLFEGLEDDLPEDRFDDNGEPMNGIHLANQYGKGGFLVIEYREEGKLTVVARMAGTTSSLDFDQAGGWEWKEVPTGDMEIREFAAKKPTAAVWTVLQAIQDLLGHKITMADMDNLEDVSPAAAKMIHKAFNLRARREKGEHPPPAGRWVGGVWYPNNAP